MTLAKGGQQQFAASALNQCAQALAAQRLLPGGRVSGIDTISSTGSRYVAKSFGLRLHQVVKDQDDHHGDQQAD